MSLLQILLGMLRGNNTNFSLLGSIFMAEWLGLPTYDHEVVGLMTEQRFIALSLSLSPFIISIWL